MPLQQANLPLGLGSRRQRGLGQQGGAYQKAGGTKARGTSHKAGATKATAVQISEADPGNQVLPCQIYPIAQNLPMARIAPWLEMPHGSPFWG